MLWPKAKLRIFNCIKFWICLNLLKGQSFKFILIEVHQTAKIKVSILGVNLTLSQFIIQEIVNVKGNLEQDVYKCIID